MITMRYILIMATLLCSLVGCSKEPINDISPPKDEGISAVTFRLSSSEIEVDSQTRSSVLLGSHDSKIWNYNIYCYNQLTDEMVRVYSDSESSSKLILSSGDWDIFAFANTGSDMGEMTRAEIEEYAYTISQTSDLIYGYRLFMVHNSTIAVDGDISIDLEMERLVAYFYIKINLTDDASDFNIIRTEVINAAASCNVFRDNPPASSTVETFTNFTTGYMVFYTMENLQGVMSHITRPEDKNENNAPANATHIKIYAESSTHEIVYTYYLGGNTINDFDIERNTRYEITININGMDSDDMRVESTKIPGTEPDPVYEIRYSQQEKTYDNVEYYILEFECGDLQSIDVEFEFVEKIPNNGYAELISRFMLNSLYTDPIETNLFMDDRNLFEKIDGEYTSLSEQTYLESNFEPDIYLSTHTKATVSANTKYAFNALLWTLDDVWIQVKVYMERGTANERSEYIQLRSYYL